jgi:serine/threonine-protein kinase HipA
MNEVDPIGLLYGGMEKLAPGSDADTLKVLDMLPRQPYPLVVDAGCGSGRQTLVLAKQLQSTVHAIDTYKPFLTHLETLAREGGVDHLIRTHCMDMTDIPDVFRDIDLLWSEGAAYSIGFPNALKRWHGAIRPGGFMVVSELCWQREAVPADVRQFFANEYPDMRSVDENLSVIRQAGYDILATHTLPGSAWMEGYYDILEPRARALLDHPDESVRAMAAGTVEEVRVFERSEGSYVYVFYILQKI